MVGGKNQVNPETLEIKMTKRPKTQMEEAQNFAQKLVASLRLHKTFCEFDKLSPSERENPENRLIWELLIKAIEIAHEDEPIEA